MGWLVEKLTDLLRPWHDDGLPEELAVGDIEAWGFVRGAMVRCAKMAAECDVAFGVFDIIGIEYARRAARAWWPKERLLMEDVSCAFFPVQERAGSAHPVPQILLDRLALLQARYLAYVGPAWPEERLRETIARYLRDHPRAAPDSPPHGAEEDSAPSA